MVVLPFNIDWAAAMIGVAPGDLIFLIAFEDMGKRPIDYTECKRNGNGDVPYPRHSEHYREWPYNIRFSCEQIEKLEKRSGELKRRLRNEQKRADKRAEEKAHTPRKTHQKTKSRR